MQPTRVRGDLSLRTHRGGDRPRVVDARCVAALVCWRPTRKDVGLVEPGILERKGIDRAHERDANRGQFREQKCLTRVMFTTVPVLFESTMDTVL